MFESRCGVCCNTCQRKETVHCKGCLIMEKPFWGGVCTVKACCENQYLDHCGLCKKFPCEMLSNMGKDHGFDPLLKIEMCKKWANEQ